MMRKGSLTNQRKLQTMRIQHSQDYKKFKTKKGETSLSPHRKEIHLQNNKENHHPNINLKYGEDIEKFINNKLNIQSPLVSNNSKGFGGLQIDKKQKQEKTDKNRDPYYILKQQSLNKKINYYGGDKDQNDLEGEKKKKQLFERPQPKSKSKSRDREDSHSQRKNKIISPIIDFKAKPSQNGNKKGEKKKKQKHDPLFIHISNNALNKQKCQFHDKTDGRNETPPAIYLVTCKPGTSVQFACCEECAHRYKDQCHNICRIPSKEIVSQPKYSYQAYLQCLYSKHNEIQKIYNNINQYEKQYRKVCEEQYKKHRNHYERIFEIIKGAMTLSQGILAKYTNQGYEIINKQRQQIQSILHSTDLEIKKINNTLKNSRTPSRISQKQPLPFEQNILNKIMAPLSKFNIQIPLIYVNEISEEILQEFSQYFFTKLAIKIYEEHDEDLQNNKASSYRQPGQQVDKDAVMEFCSHKTNKNGQLPETDRNMDLFCDQMFGESGVSNNFSFEANQQEQLKVQPHQCIIELVEEQDIISPNFKQI